MSKCNTNENYIHSCNCPLVKADEHICSFSKIGFRSEEFYDIIEFYLLKAPIQKSDAEKQFGLTKLGEYGWVGNAGMSKLERELLKSSGISSFCFIKADTISETLEQMQLGNERWCVEHPRAVLKQDFKVKLHENGRVEIIGQEKRMECLFRHIRNSIAHNHIYYFENGNMVLEDVDNQSKKTVTARILIRKETLIDWMYIIKKNILIEGDKINGSI
jgi:hypothetical protein